mgnify:CR=1 FL=1
MCLGVWRNCDEQLPNIARTKKRNATAAYQAEKADGGLRRRFAAYTPEWVDTISMDYAGHALHEIPPNGQGIAALIALGILKHFDVAGMPVDGALSQHEWSSSS